MGPPPPPPLPARLPRLAGWMDAVAAASLMAAAMLSWPGEEILFAFMQFHLLYFSIWL